MRKLSLLNWFFFSPLKVIFFQSIKPITLFFRWKKLIDYIVIVKNDAEIINDAVGWFTISTWRNFLRQSILCNYNCIRIEFSECYLPKERKKKLQNMLLYFPFLLFYLFKIDLFKFWWIHEFNLIWCAFTAKWVEINVMHVIKSAREPLNHIVTFWEVVFFFLNSFSLGTRD